MNTRNESTSRTFIRSVAMGVLISMLFFYTIHVFGSWRVENYRPDPDTTYTVLLHNNCLFFDKTHTLRPNTDISQMNNSIDGTKLGGSFMNFFDGHIVAMIIFALLTGVIIFSFWNNMKKNNLARQTQ